MGTLFFFDEEVSLNNNPRVECKPRQVEVLDNHAVPEIVIGPVGEAYNGERATFNNWKQFEDFVEAINNLHSRLKDCNK
ncbi:MAG: hypothetical protein OQJ77_05480 [Thiovulaceae bacterium]|nr:hypothetical protein [Sulfurimonadaceae bacterium]MCW9026748.1 hypothetical protein [Sulfurimonadaceae bacterium]